MKISRSKTLGSETCTVNEKCPPTILTLPNNRVFSTFDINDTEAEILSNNDDKINFVWHFADTHVRATNDMLVDEYKTVFSNIFDSMKLNLIESRNATNAIDLEIIETTFSKAKYVSFNQIQNIKEKIVPLVRDSLIVIAGDVLHKHNIYDDLEISLIRSWIRGLTYISNVIIIGGNHDFHLYIRGRQALNCLLDIDNVHVLLESKNYIYNNLVFNVYSLYDNKLPNVAEQICNDKLRIALYHGSVNSNHCLPDTDIKYKALPLEAFTNSNFGFFGDRHSQQYLDDTKHFAYSSSLVQMSIKEHLTNHGYLYWNLQTGESEYMRIKNKYGRIRFTFEDNILTNEPELTELNIINCKCINSNYEECRKIVEDYIKNKNKKFVNIESDMEVKSKEIIGIEHNNLLESLATSECQMRLINEYIKQCPDEKDEEFLKEIFDIHNKLFKEIDTTSTVSRNNSFKIRRFYFSNVYSFGPNNMIDFSDLSNNNIVGIVGPNKTGKSNIFKALLFAIFASEDKVNPKGIINNQSNGDLFTMVEIEQDGIIYAILRANQIAFGNGAKEYTKDSYTKIMVDLLIYNPDTGIYSKYDANIERDGIEKKIFEICGKESDLRNLFFMMQTNKKCNFIDLAAISPAETFKYFSQHYDWHIYESLWRKSNDIITKTNVLMTDLNKKIGVRKKTFDTDIGTCQLRIDNFKKQIEEINGKFKLLDEKRTQYQLQSTSEHIKVKYPEFSSYSTEQLTEMFNDIQNKMHDIKEEKNNKDEEKGIIEQRIGLLDSRKQDIYACIVQKINGLRNGVPVEGGHVHLIVEQYDKILLNHEFDQIESKIASSQRKLFYLNSNIKDLETGYINDHLNKYDAIVQKLVDLISNAKNKKASEQLINEINREQFISMSKNQMSKLIIEEQKRLKHYQNKYNALKKKRYDSIITCFINNVSLNDNSKSQQDEYTKELLDLLRQMNDYESLIKASEVEKTEIIQSRDSCNTIYLDHTITKKVIAEIIESNEKNSLIDEKLVTAAKIFNNLTDEKKKFTEELNKEISKRDDIIKKQQDHQALVAQLDNYKDKLVKYKYYRDMVCPNGIPKLILKNIIHKTEITTNEILSLFSTTSVKFVLTDGNSNTTKDHDAYPDIKIQTIHKIPIDLNDASSGFETFVLNFSIRQSIIKLFNIKACNFVFVDEFLSTLDVVKVDLLKTFFKYLTSEYDTCYVISHNNAINSHYKNIVQVLPGNASASIQYDDPCNIEQIRNHIQFLINQYVIKKKSKVKKISTQKVSTSVQKDYDNKLQNRKIELKSITLKSKKPRPIQSTQNNSLNTDPSTDNITCNSKESDICSNNNNSNQSSTNSHEKSLPDARKRPRKNKLSNVFDTKNFDPKILNLKK
jgi:DNA repair exonuclease SbcCD ATPase subunit